MSTSQIHAQEELQLIDKIIGVVGNEIILLSDHSVQKSELISRGMGTGEELKCTVMENLLFEKLLLNQARLDSIEIPEESVEIELEQRIGYFTQQLGGPDQLEQFYGKSTEQIKQDFRELLKDQMLTQRMQQRLSSEVYITPADIEEFYNKIPEDSIPLIGSEVEIAHIVKKPEPSKEEKRRAEERLNQLRKDIVGGKDFAVMASLYSDDKGSAVQGGSLGLARKGTMVGEFEAMAFAIEEGEVSPVFETEFGYHIMQLIERRGETFESRHILIKPKISPEDIQTAISDLDSISVLIQTDSISFGDAAKRNSDDEDSKFSNGVILNPSNRSVRFAVQDIDPQIFFVIDKLEVGEHSEPVLMQYPDGSQAYRILKLVNRTEPHKANLVDDYQLIQEMARNSISQNSLYDWVNSTVKRTYIRVEDEYSSCEFEHGWVQEEN
ncbi:MAG: peptidylprolyl isomerase [Flavobacteriales bacterium]|nr:peptidylprolyl isomerase [Flavobacteriales bacterium]